MEFVEQLQKYLNALRDSDHKEITEHTHRKDLQELIEYVAYQTNPEIKVIHEPTREEVFGAPDFKIKKVESVIGYIENKPIGHDISESVNSKQLKKYSNLSNNILVTNYLEWIWIKQGTVVGELSICNIEDLKGPLRGSVSQDKAKSLQNTLSKFFSQPPVGIKNPKKLAEALAIRSKYLHEILNKNLREQEETNNQGRLFGLYQTFKNNIFSDLTIDDFSDAFAQTLAYGLFISKLNANDRIIDLYNAKKFIQPSFSLIKELLDFIDELHKEEYVEAKWIVDEILSIMNNLDLRNLTKKLSYQKIVNVNLFEEEEVSLKDPYVYFYEDYLAAYDKKLRKSKGVYYTPPPVVNFIVRSIDNILQRSFSISKGFADHKKVTVLDFATGTGTFLIEILELILKHYPKSSGKRNLIIRDHILQNLYGFEYLTAPYSVAHLKISQFLKDVDYTLNKEERLKIYLTNTLEPSEGQTNIPLLPALSKESRRAQEVKDMPILVITGNPPYSNKSKNSGEWIKNLIQDYKPTDEKKLNLDDDYIKFIRFAHWKLQRVEKGVIGIITNNSFLDGITHRKMRNELRNSFNKIYILNLHGNTRLGEDVPKDKVDENVFDIQQSVTITIFVKEENEPQNCEVYYQDLWGKRNEKYEFLYKTKLSDINFESLNIDAFNELFNQTRWAESFNDTLSLFIPLEKSDKLTDYGNSWGVNQIFKVNGSGIQTDRDSLFIDFKENTLADRINTLLNGNLNEDFRNEFRIKNSSSFPLLDRIENNEFSEDNIKNFQFSPFDFRKVYYQVGLTSRPAKKVMLPLLRLENNYALICSRQTKQEFKHSFVTNSIVNRNILDSSGSGGNGKLFPLYIIDETNNLFSEGEEFDVLLNFTSDFRQYINDNFGNNLTPEQIFGYIYAVLNSQVYRELYDEYLRIDYPRIPFNVDIDQIHELSEYGWNLIRAHTELAYPDGNYLDLGEFRGSGSDIIEFVEFKQPHKNELGKVFINRDQYFNDVSKEVWSFSIGGFQVLENYLSNRSGISLNIDQVRFAEDLIKVINYTLDIRSNINNSTEFLI